MLKIYFQIKNYYVLLKEKKYKIFMQKYYINLGLNFQNFLNILKNIILKKNHSTNYVGIIMAQKIQILIKIYSFTLIIYVKVLIDL